MNARSHSFHFGIIFFLRFSWFAFDVIFPVFLSFARFYITLGKIKPHFHHKLHRQTHTRRHIERPCRWRNFLSKEMRKICIYVRIKRKWNIANEILYWTHFFFSLSRFLPSTYFPLLRQNKFVAWWFRFVCINFMIRIELTISKFIASWRLQNEKEKTLKDGKMPRKSFAVPFCCQNNNNNNKKFLLLLLFSFTISH